MIDRLLDNPLATVFGLIGMACLAIWPLFRSRFGMLTAQTGINVGLGLHYALLGAHTAVLMQALSLLQILLALPIGSKPWARLLYVALIPVIAAAMALTWSGPHSLYAAVALIFITLARAQTSPIRLRVLMLFAGPCWFAHDFMIASLPAMAADVLGFGIGAWKLAGILRARTTPFTA